MSVGWHDEDSEVYARHGLVSALLSWRCGRPSSAHHSYAMYDGSIYKVFTGVIVRIVPNAAHFEMHFVPLNETRDALVRDEKGEQLVWVVQMESAAEAFRHGIRAIAFRRAPS